MEDPGDRPVFDPGDIVESPNGDLNCKIIEHIGEGRCCMVYSAKSIRDGSKVALKVFKRGPTYEGAVQREQYILELFNDHKHNMVMLYGSFVFRGLHCQVMELLDCNIRSVIFRNERQGLSPWATQKFGRDVLTSLLSLHEHSFVHADLKPANVMWSSNDGTFKILDFGLTFHTEEEDLHQIQSAGYKAPEAAEWNKYKEDKKKKRKRKLQGTYNDLTKAAPPQAYEKDLNVIGKTEEEEKPLTITATVTTTESSIQETPIPEGASRTILRAPPRRHRPPGSKSGSSDRESIIVLDEYKRTSRRGSANSVTSDGTTASEIVTSMNSNAVAAAAASVAAACNKWLSESSGIFTASTSTAAAASNSSVDNYSSSVLTASRTTTATATTTASTTVSNVFTSSMTNTNNSSATSAEVVDNDNNEVDQGQDWRRGRTRSRPKSSSSSKRGPRPTSVCAALAEKERPPAPNSAVDMWSYGCLLAEVLTGSKLFSATDKMASVLKPRQLLEMKIGEAEIRYDGLGEQQFFQDAKDLITKCLIEDPTERIDAKDAMNHPLFKDHDELMPSAKDMALLPSAILKLHNLFANDKYKDSEELEDAIRDVRESAEQFGRVLNMTAHGSHAFIEFQEASDAQDASAGLTGKTFDNVAVFPLFYPLTLWSRKILNL